MKLRLFLLPLIFLYLYSCKRPENTEYNKDGSINKRTIYLTSDKSNYRELTYYKDEQLKELQEYSNGVRNGRNFSYYENGSIKSVYYYDMGKLTSIGRFYNEQGKLTDKGLFINDSMVVKEEFYYENDLLKVYIFSKNNRSFDEAGSLLYNNKGMIGLDNSFYYLVNSVDSIAWGDSIRVTVDFIAKKTGHSHMSLSLGNLDENLQYVTRGKTYTSDSLSVSFFYNPYKMGYNLILGKLRYIVDIPQEQVKEFIFYHDFLAY